MELVKIQHKETKDIVQYRMNGQIVSENKYKEEYNREIYLHKRHPTFLTNKTKSGNYRHAVMFSI